ncbi:MAG TPA: hypothetical protein VGB86_04265 [Methylomirabilota bacterium]|jgi:hypothetical protein
MRRFVDHLPATRWLLAILVVILVLGHVCELPAYVELASHHSAADNADEQLSSCDAVTVTSSSSHSQVWTGLDMAMALLIIDVSPVRSPPQFFEDPADLASRLPLFLLHASLLI